MICTRHICRELAQKLLWITGLLLLVFSSHRLVGFLGDAMAGGLHADMVFIMLGYKVVASMPKLMPVMLMLAVLFSFVRMKRDRELMTLAGVGLGARYQLGVVLGFASVYAVLALVFVAWLAPLAERQLSEALREMQREANVSGISAGQFRRFGNTRTVYVQNIAEDRRSMEQIFLHTQRARDSVILRARTARFDHSKDSGRRYLEFNDGQRHVGRLGDEGYQLTRFQRYAVFPDQKGVARAETDTSTLVLTELFGPERPDYLAERHWRYALVIACVLLALFAVLVVQSTPGDRYMLPITTAILVYLSYSNLLAIGTRLLGRQDMPSEAGLWWVHFILLAGIAFMFHMPLLQRRRRAGRRRAMSNAR